MQLQRQFVWKTCAIVQASLYFLDPFNHQFNTPIYFYQSFSRIAHKGEHFSIDAIVLNISLQISMTMTAVISICL